MLLLIILKDKNNIFKLGKEARFIESKVSKEEPFEKIEWEKKKQFKFLNQDSVRGFFIGIVSSIAASLIWV